MEAKRTSDRARYGAVDSCSSTVKGYTCITQAVHAELLKNTRLGLGDRASSRRGRGMRCWRYTAIWIYRDLFGPIYSIEPHDLLRMV